VERSSGASPCHRSPRRRRERSTSRAKPMESS
jgi:hypothetical protein